MWCEVGILPLGQAHRALPPQHVGPHLGFRVEGLGFRASLYTQNLKPPTFEDAKSQNWKPNTLKPINHTAENSDPIPEARKP